MINVLLDGEREGGREENRYLLNGKNISFRLVKSNSKGEIQTKYSVL